MSSTVAAEQPPAEVPDGASADALTLGRLVLERPLRRIAPPALPAQYASRSITWCAPWAEARETADDLSGILLFAHEFTAADRRSAAARGAVAVVVAAHHDGAPAVDLGAEPPVLYAGAALTWSEVSRLVADLTLARETHVLRYGRTVHRSLAELLYRGAGLSAVCHQMARLSNCAVAIMDPQFHVLAFEQDRQNVHEPGALAAALRVVITVEPTRHHVAPEVYTIATEHSEIACVVAPIVMAGRHDGWVAIFEPDPHPHPHDLSEHRIVAEQASSIVGTELLRMRSVEQAEERAKGDFVHALLHNRFATQRELEVRAAHYDLPVDETFGVVVVGGLRSAGSDSLSALLQIARDSLRVLPDEGRHTLASVVGDFVAIVRELRPATRSTDTPAAQLEQFAAAVERDLAARLGRPVTVTYGRPYPGAGQITASYREARTTQLLQNRLSMTGVCGYAELRVYAVLSELAPSEQGRAFAREMLGPLRSAQGSNADLEETVLAYVAAGGNINAAARALHVHRNTMLYKLDRASRALGTDIRQAETQFAVWLAHKLSLLADADDVVTRDLGRL